MLSPAGRLPVTVLGGLSSALREQVAVRAVRDRERCCAVLYDLEAEGEDIVLLRRVLDVHGEHDREPVALVGCCLACSVRADVGVALDLVVGAGRWVEALVSVPSAVTPAGVARALEAHAGARPDTVAVAVDTVLLEAQLSGGDLLADRGLAAAPTDRRSTAELLVAQVEDADVVVLGGLHRLQPSLAARAQALLAHLGPLALQVPVASDGAGADAAVGTGRSAGLAGREQREHLSVLAAAVCPPSCGVTTLVWSADRALHPGRLRDALDDVVGAVVRSRGQISLSLAGRPGRRVRWESAGECLSFGDPVVVDGPARCDLVLTGTGLDAAALCSLLDSCLERPDETGPADEHDPFHDALGPAGAVDPS